MYFGGKWFTGNDTFHDYSAAQTDSAVYTPGSGKTVFVTGYTISTSDANTITVKVGSTTVLKFYFGTNGGANVEASEIPIFRGQANEAITITSSATTNHSIALSGFEL